MKITTLEEILACPPDVDGWRTLSDGRRVQCDQSARIGKDAVISEYTSIGEDAVIGRGAEIGEYARIDRGAVISEYTSIGEGARIGEGTVIGKGEVINDTPIYIQGSRWFICQASADGRIIQSGCITKPLDWWVENVRRCAEENDYTPAQVEEYAAYVDLLVRLAEIKEHVTDDRPETGDSM